MASLLLATLASGCGRDGWSLAPNQRPTLTLTSGPIDTSSAHPVAWSVPIAWEARDPDGTITHVSYAVDPPTPAQVAAGAETAWVNTKASSVVVRFRATTVDSLAPNTTASDFHVFVARAWDNSDGASEPVVRSFYAYTVAPTARIERPAADPLLVHAVPTAFSVVFSGDDPDGIDSRVPREFRIRLIKGPSPLYTQLATDPDALRREAEATNWRWWSTQPGSQTTFPLVNLDEANEWAVAVAAVDEAGAITPQFSLDRNVVRFVPSAVHAPRLHILGPGFDFTLTDGSPSADSSRWIHVGYPVSTRAAFSWSAVPAQGRQIVGYRWVLDPIDLALETPRPDEERDIRYWSRWSTASTSTGPLPAWTQGQHMLYIQAEDDLGARALGVVHVDAYPLAFDRPLLIVDETRLEVDHPGSNGCRAPYAGRWPSAAELDSFLIAVGGVPWRCTVNPPGAVSVPGLFAGYGAHKITTRANTNDLASLVPLALLTRYRHVLWLVDIDAGLASLDTPLPQTVMKWMSRPGNIRMLEDYTRLGGKVWLAGGGGALASLLDFDAKSNNTSSNVIFAAGTDLWPQSYVVSVGHLRTKVSASRSQGQILKSSAAVRSWSGHGPNGDLRAPDYSKLPVMLFPRTPATDPLPPTRPTTQSNLFYTSSTGIECAHGTVVLEDFGEPGAPRIESALDTLYDGVGSQVHLPPSPTMLYYHGREHAPVLYSGFDIWSWSRPECQALVDFVLQEIWGLHRTGAPGASVRATFVSGRRPTPQDNATRPRMTAGPRARRP
jgi:hypothetical protein